MDLLADLEAINRYIAQLKNRVVLQRRAIDGYAQRGWPTDEAERMLGALLTSLEQMTLRRTAALASRSIPGPDRSLDSRLGG
jgi:hypothetical protein